MVYFKQISIQFIVIFINNFIIFINKQFMHSHNVSELSASRETFSNCIFHKTLKQNVKQKGITFCIKEIQTALHFALQEV